MNYTWLIQGFMAAFMLSLILVYGARQAALKLNVLDPVGDPLKVHTMPVPYMGGLGFGISFLAVMAVMTSLMGAWSAKNIVAWLYLVALMALGFSDDLKGLSPRLRFLIQIGLGLLLWFTGLRVNFFPGTILPVVSTAVMTAGLVNSINMFDGLDGLAGGTVCISAAGFHIVSLHSSSFGAAFSGTLVSVLLAFLVFNFHPAKIFMGDAGSYFLGGVLALLATPFLSETWDIASLFAMVFMVGLPIFDAATTLVRRKLSGAPLTYGDRGHVYDLVHRRLGAVRPTVLTFYLLQSSSVAFGVWLMLR